MSNFRLHPGTIHKTYWAAPRQGLPVKARMTHRPTGLFIDYYLSRTIDAERSAMFELTHMVRRDVGREIA